MLSVISQTKGLDTNQKDVFFEKMNYRMIKMQFIEEAIYIFDQNMTTKKYLIEQTRDRLKCVHESRLLEEATFACERYKDNPKFYHIADTGMFIGPAFY